MRDGFQEMLKEFFLAQINAVASLKYQSLS